MWEPRSLKSAMYGCGLRAVVESIMRVRALLTSENRGASEVVSVILMMAITVIIASVIGAFALGFGDRTTSTVPQASFL